MNFAYGVRERLTGRVAGRRQMFTGKVVLQVEVEIQIGSTLPPCPPPPGYTDCEAWERQELELIEKSWRTAKTEFRDAKQSEISDSRIYKGVL